MSLLGEADESSAQAPAVHIAPEHQSSPKEHWSEPAVRLAAEEIAPFIGAMIQQDETARANAAKKAEAGK